MQALLEHFITQSVMYSLIAVALVAFLESLALVGLILPGTVMMAGAWGADRQRRGQFLAGVDGRYYWLFAGDWISFWLGWRFKKPLHRWSFMKKIKRCWIKPSTRCTSTACSPSSWGASLAQRARWCRWWPGCWICPSRSLWCRTSSAASSGRRSTSCRGSGGRGHRYS